MPYQAGEAPPRPAINEPSTRARQDFAPALSIPSSAERRSYEWRDEPRPTEDPDMRVMVIMKATPASEAGELPSERLLAAMGAYNEQLVDAGVLLAGEGLHPSSRGARVRFGAAGLQVVDGPFTDTKELAAGFWLLQVRSFDEAIEWARRIPNPDGDDFEVELRPVFEADDFGDAFTPELREQEDQLRARIDARP